MQKITKRPMGPELRSVVIVCVGIALVAVIILIAIRSNHPALEERCQAAFPADPVAAGACERNAQDDRP